MAWLPDGEKSLLIRLAVSTEYRVTDRRTDERTSCDSIVRAKNPSIFLTQAVWSSPVWLCLDAVGYQSRANECLEGELLCPVMLLLAKRSYTLCQRLRHSSGLHHHHQQQQSVFFQPVIPTEAKQTRPHWNIASAEWDARESVIAAFHYSSKLQTWLQTWLSTCVSVSKARRKQVESMSKDSCKLA